MARQVSVQIELEGGKELRHYSYLRIEQPLTTHHTFELGVTFQALEDKSEHFFHRAHQDVCGQLITFSFNPADQADQQSFDFVFRGLVTEITLASSSDLSSSFILKGYSPTIVLEDAPVRRTFLQKNLEQIAETVLEPYPQNLLRRRLKPRNTDAIPYAVQYDETAFQFLSRLAAEWGEWFYYDGRDLILGEHKSSNAVDFSVDGIQTSSMGIGLQPAKLAMSAFNYREPAQYRSQSAGQSVNGLDQFGRFALQQSERLFGQAASPIATRPVYSQHELDSLVTSEKAVKASGLISFQGRGEWPQLQPGRVVNVQGVVLKRNERSSESFGKFRITAIRHEVDRSGNYQNQFEAIPDSVIYPPPNPAARTPVAQTELAQVIDNNDPDQLGRVRVAFFWPGQDHESDWLRVSTPYSGEGEGLIFVPEQDAQVVIGYENNRAEWPFVLGSLYPKKEGVSYTNSGNNLKTIQTRSGNQILFSDDAGQEKIQITNADHSETTLTLEFGGNGTITLKTSGTIQLEGGTLALKAQQNLTLEAGNEIQLKGQAGVQIGSPQVTINADATASLQAGAALTLKGATTNLSADALVEVKGALITLN